MNDRKGRNCPVDFFDWDSVARTFSFSPVLMCKFLKRWAATSRNVKEDMIVLAMAKIARLKRFAWPRLFEEFGVDEKQVFD